MNLSDIRYELLTKAGLVRMSAVINELKISPFRLERFLDYPQNLAFVAIYDNEAVGLIYGYSLTSLDCAPQLFVYSVDVLPNYQGNGIGSGLFRFVVDYSRENGFSECFVITDKGNKRACRVYEKAGGKNDFEDEIVYVIKHDSPADPCGS